MEWTGNVWRGSYIAVSGSFKCRNDWTKLEWAGSGFTVWGNAWKKLDLNENRYKYGIPKSCTQFCSCCAGLRNTREVALLWESVPKLACAAEQA